jgi:hypothetical protein
MIESKRAVPVEVPPLSHLSGDLRQLASVLHVILLPTKFIDRDAGGECKIEYLLVARTKTITGKRRLRI